MKSYLEFSAERHYSFRTSRQQQYIESVMDKDDTQGEHHLIRYTSTGILVKDPCCFHINVIRDRQWRFLDFWLWVRDTVLLHIVNFLLSSADLASL